jgi:hypothetical protein
MTKTAHELSLTVKASNTRAIAEALLRMLTFVETYLYEAPPNNILPISMLMPADHGYPPHWVRVGTGSFSTTQQVGPDTKLSNLEWTWTHRESDLVEIRSSTSTGFK